MLGLEVDNDHCFIKIFLETGKTNFLIIATCVVIKHTYVSLDKFYF